MNPKDTAECHQTLSLQVGPGHKTAEHLHQIACLQTVIPRPSYPRSQAFSGSSFLIVCKTEWEGLVNFTMWSTAWEWG